MQRSATGERTLERLDDQAGGEVEEESPDGCDVQNQPGELRHLRQKLPDELRELFGVGRNELLVETAIYQKILRNHPGDAAYLERIGLLIENWRFAGASPKAASRFEIYGQIDDIWFTAVVCEDVPHDRVTLVTMHRIYRRKAESRLRKGYLRERES